MVDLPETKLTKVRPKKNSPGKEWRGRVGGEGERERVVGRGEEEGWEGGVRRGYTVIQVILTVVLAQAGPLTP